MILPIYAYGWPVLKKISDPIDILHFVDLPGLLQNMWETMYDAKGVGLAAPQIGLGIRLFIIDTLPYEEVDKPFKGMKKVIINAQKIEESGTPWPFEEGCLSIPDLRAEVERPFSITLRYENETGDHFTETFEGLNARVVQHEYDHTEGILFTDHLKPLKKRMIQRRLESIRKGQVEADYRMKFYKRS